MQRKVCTVQPLGNRFAHLDTSKIALHTLRENYGECSLGSMYRQNKVAQKEKKQASK